ncbi:tail fiber protein [Acaryochloris sp. IP29b_bin.137]|uniref:phage tail protein n=1 Tax=Acaryochloris sp. IP29b_bin.137 TaxID=2969217 RepID=UPI002626247E|nr:tail fiber protein [Acaryochloris sp. IP29b_bin.137]
MADPFIGEIRIFAGNFAPRGWAFCNGNTVSVSQNTALFSILGTIYGGDGRTTFALPNLQGRSPRGVGQGPGLNNVRIGEKSGNDTVTLNESQMPSHNHSLEATSQFFGASGDPTNRTFDDITQFQDTNSNLVSLSAQAIASQGGSQSHNNLQPYLVVNYIIALEGTYPSRG